MNYFTCKRRDSDNPRWKVVSITDGESTVVALSDTQSQGDQLANDLNELRRMRVLLAVAGKTVALAQACAILSCSPADIERWTNSCLAKGFK